uniref:DUF7841 domain-containing protein n=1 Tax=Siphoviridae sp. ct9lR64 TaxID=2826178 RepID=A0A8S5QX52_9CAUD|nr:MAG TPA: hypothetical protein [Siphoviridae sp. ct9lR64]
MLTKKYIDEEIEALCEHHDELDSRSLSVLADLIYVKKHFHLVECGEEFTSEMAKTWVSGMENTDKTTGMHWTKEQTSAVLKTLGKNIDPCMFWAVMNSIYSDYGSTLTKHGVVTPEAYGELAIDWICDDDAVKDKAAMYYKYIVAHD